MNKLAILVLVLFIGTGILSTGCDKGDDPQPVYLSSFKYTPDNKTVTKGAVLTGTVAVVTPTKAKVEYSIKGIKKGSAGFTNPTTKGFKIDKTNGKLSLESGNTIDKAIYTITVEGVDQNKKTVKKTALYKVTIK